MASLSACARAVDARLSGHVAPRVGHVSLFDALADRRQLAGAYRFGREQRLGSASIANILARGRRFKTGVWSLSVLSNGMPIARLGLIVPKRQIAKAVGRNALKRRIREWFRHRQADFAGKDLLVRLMSAPRADNEVQSLEALSRQLK